MASGSPFREWGDGATDVRTHVIEDISYSADAIVCRCGAVIRGIRDGSGWVGHGGSVLRMTDAAERGAEPGPSAESKAANALFLVVAVGKRCTCSADSDVRDCPNFITADLEDLPWHPDDLDNGDHFEPE